MKLVLALLAPAALTAPLLVPRAPEEPQLADLAWMAGTWSSTADGMLTHEAWLPPAGGLMLGMNRSAAAEAGPRNSTSYEYLRIEERADGLVYVASPMGRGTTAFPLADVGDRFVVFANPEHDFPQEIRYELTAAGALHARVSGTIEGAEQAMEWTWRKQ
jgi:hypothetical protein